MSARSPRMRRLEATYWRMKDLSEKCSSVMTAQGKQPRFEFTHNGNPDQGEFPDLYAVSLRVEGVISAREERRLDHSCTIFLPVEYPTAPPIIKWHTPIFHPNIRTFDEQNELYRELLQDAGSEELMTKHINSDPMFAELLAGYVCLDILEKNWTPAVDLDALVIEIANMVRYRTYNADLAYNRAAAKWAREKEELKGFFPLDVGLLEIQDVVDPVVVRVVG